MAIAHLKDCGVVAKNFKCFGKKAQGFYEFHAFNIIVGRNNSGKSALIDLLGCLCKKHGYDLNRLGHLSRHTPEIIHRRKVTEALFNDLKKYGEQKIGSHRARQQYEEAFRPSRYIAQRETGGVPKPISSNEQFDEPIISSETLAYEGHMRDICSYLPRPFQYDGLQFFRILADRDIQREGGNFSNQALELAENGNGTTKIIASFLNDATKDHRAVDQEMLSALNQIYHGDAVFTQLRAREVEGAWEVFLEEEHKGLVALSQSGSSLKTVLLVLTNLILMVKLKNVPLDKTIFCFEELENNLHPALLRRLLAYLYEYRSGSRCMFVLTTHSNVMIDWFARAKDAQILHITHNGETASVKRALNYGEHSDIIDDLDVRASDLLQANGIIWVEGPSERLYLNHWISLWSDGELSEGAQYQIAMYGGALLSHYSADDPGQVEGLSSLLRINRNCALIADSDRQNTNCKTKPRLRLKPAVKKIKEEIEGMQNGMIWVSARTVHAHCLPCKPNYATV